MVLSRFYKAALKRFEKLCNTLYYAFSDKQEIIVVSAFMTQLFNNIHHNNIGDDLNAVLLSYLTGKKVLAYDAFYHSRHPIDNLMAIGSVADWMGNSKTTVWGSGFLKCPTADNDKQNSYSLGRVCAVRGKKTREALLKAGIECPEVYGDPALLMPLIYRPSVQKVKGRMGIIPHYVDIDNPNVERLLNELGDDGVLIRVSGYKNWKEVIDLLYSCEFVISSSLHGLILADAYGIPNQWVVFSDLLVGGSFKFEDYYSVVGKDARPVLVKDETTFHSIYEQSKPYQAIKFDPLPLLKACPVEIVRDLLRT